MRCTYGMQAPLWRSLLTAFATTAAIAATATSSPAADANIQPCRSAVDRGVLPTWARDGFSEKPAAHGPRGRSLGQDRRAGVRRAAAVATGEGAQQQDPLGLARGHREHERPPDPRPADARGIESLGNPVARTVPGGPGPSIIDLPGTGCWRLTLSWSDARTRSTCSTPRPAAPDLGALEGADVGVVPGSIAVPAKSRARPRRSRGAHVARGDTPARREARRRRVDARGILARERAPLAERHARAVRPAAGARRRCSSTSWCSSGRPRRERSLIISGRAERIRVRVRKQVVSSSSCAALATKTAEALPLRRRAPGLLHVLFHSRARAAVAARGQQDGMLEASLDEVVLRRSRARCCPRGRRRRGPEPSRLAPPLRRGRRLCLDIGFRHCSLIDVPPRPCSRAPSGRRRCRARRPTLSPLRTIRVAA